MSACCRVGGRQIGCDISAVARPNTGIMTRTLPPPDHAAAVIAEPTGSQGKIERERERERERGREEEREEEREGEREGERQREGERGECLRGRG